MSYAQSVLQPGETIIATGRLHWIIYRWAIAFLVAGVILAFLARAYLPEYQRLPTITGVVFGVLFLMTFAYAWFVRWITEFAVTNKRVISSRVFVSRKTEEMNMDKVETIDIEQPILGRILGYGTVRIIGTGGSNDIVVGDIAAPFELRNAILVK